MERIVLNPENYESQYLQHLNECFTNWGGEKEHDWVFARMVGKHSSDIMLIENEEDGVIAGSAVSYRTLFQNQKRIEIGIMTGSWTLPAARRKGCFSKIIETSTNLCDKRNVPFLTAFVTETNPSCRRLESAGSYMFPTFHLFSPEFFYSDVLIPEKRPKSEALNHKIFLRFKEFQSQYLSFEYFEEEFIAQYLNRPKDVVILELDGDYAILEDGNNEVKILFLTFKNKEDFRKNIKAITNWCLENKKKKAFYFTTRKELKEICLEENFHNVPGFFTILKNDANYNESIEKTFEHLNINMADKM